MSFQGLPREVRNKIYFFVIHLERAAPPSPHDPSLSTKYQVRDKRHRFGRPVLESFYYEGGPLQFPYTSLSCTNRQIRAEVREAVTAVRSAGNLIYKVDLLVDDIDIYVTWLSIPAPAKHLAELKVDFRRVGASDTVRWTGDGGPGSLTQILARLLSRFIAHGQAFFGETYSEAEETRLDVLRLQVIDTDFSVRPENCESPLDDFYGLNRCAGQLVGYDILGHKIKTVRVHHNERHSQHAIPERQPSERHLALWSDYGWYRGPTTTRNSWDYWE
jgi:hypothetical protein